jgi:NAD+ synthase (glutamine-hydrolysing)
MKIALAQIAPIVGAFDHNVDLILEAWNRARKHGADLVITPELSVCGYPPHDLMHRPEIFDRTQRALNKIAKATAGEKKTALAVGHVSRNPKTFGRMGLNDASVFLDGERVFTQSKTLLPTYDVFDEARYFESSKKSRAWTHCGKKVAFAICEDLWALDPAVKRRVYGNDPTERICGLNPDLVISMSASPFELGKDERREKLHQEVAKKVGAPLVYVNQTGSTDEILFDGGSFVSSADGQMLGRLRHFETAYGVYELGSDSWAASEGREDQRPEAMEILRRALVSGIRDYFTRTGFKQAIVGLSGGIDSALVAALAAEALGPQNILGVAMPSPHSSSHSLSDAEALARNLGIRFEIYSIKFPYTVMKREFGEARGGQLADLADENLQSRLRGLTLMTYANHLGALVLTTGNKSEMAVGYCTQYGDMVGALAVIGDVYKTQVFELAKYLNRDKEVIPQNTITKPPSAELRPDQKDTDSLPPYEVLDPFLRDYLENNHSAEDLVKEHEGKAEGTWARDILRKVELNEFKRRQAAPVLKVTPKAFGIGRRVPIAKHWDQGI